jgi:hypothetical protein
MRCVNGHDNPDDQRFCGECGVVLDQPRAYVVGTEPTPPATSQDPVPSDPAASPAPRPVSSSTASTRRVSEPNDNWSKGKRFYWAAVAFVVVGLLIVLVMNSLAKPVEKKVDLQIYCIRHTLSPDC